MESFSLGPAEQTAPVGVGSVLKGSNLQQVTHLLWIWGQPEAHENKDSKEEEKGKRANN